MHRISPRYAGSDPIGHKTIAQSVHEIGKQIVADLIEHQGAGPSVQVTLCPIAQGGLIFYADLLRNLRHSNSHHPGQLQIANTLVIANRYIGDQPVEKPTVTLPPGLERNVRGRHVIVVDDVIETGVTLHTVTQALRQFKPLSIKYAILLNKPQRRQIDIEPDYCGFIVDKAWRVGYGMDFDDLYRHFPDIVTLDYARRHRTDSGWHEAE